MTVLYISDFDLAGSGYSGIATKLCTLLSQSGYDVQALGLGYTGNEHPYPFRIAPLNHVGQIAPVVMELRRQGVQIEAIVTALDIPLQEAILQQLNTPNDMPYIGLFPIEAPPLTQSWALSLLRMDYRLVMSHFGVEACEAAGIPATYIPIGVDGESWRATITEERSQLRQGLGIKDDTFVVLTVADNQERKFLSRSMEIFAEAYKGKDAKYLMVTRPNSPVGWKLQDYALELGIISQVSVWDRGMPFKQLWSLFAVADCFLLTSKAEGLAMPVLEAMAMRLPVVGTDCTAIQEHLADRRGWLIECNYKIRDPFGNGWRYYADTLHGAILLKQLQGEDNNAINDIFNRLDNAQYYALQRTWDKTAKVLIDAIEHVKSVRQPAQGDLVYA